MGGFQTGPEPVAEVDSGWAQMFVLTVLLMNVAFPIVALVYAKSILAKRPGVNTVSMPVSEKSAAGIAGGTLIIAIFGFLAFLAGTSINFWGFGWSAAALLALFGIAAGSWFSLRSKAGKDMAKETEKLEDQMPDMLFQLGSRLGEGQALERALDDVAVTMAGTEIGEFLGGALARMRRSGTGLGEILFNAEDGILNNHPSRKLRASMRLIIEAAAKDPETAGTILIAMSNHMRDLANSDKEMRLKLRSTIDSMKNTAILFAPVIMGVTVGLYKLLADTFGDMNGAATMPAPYFILIIGIYLLATVATIMYFCSGIEHGRGRWKRDTAVALPVAAIIFCITSLGALMAFG